MDTKVDLTAVARDIDRILGHKGHSKQADAEAYAVFNSCGLQHGKRDGIGRTVLHRAAVLCRPDTVNWIQGAVGIDHNDLDEEGLTALDHAAKANRMDVVKAMLQCELVSAAERINYLNYDALGVTTARRARRAGHEEVAVLLEQHEHDQAKAALSLVNMRHAAANLADQRGWTGLHWAAHEADWGKAERLIGAGANSHAQDRNGETALWLAVRQGDLEGFRMLTRGRGSVEALWGNLDGKTLLFEAAESESEHAAEIVVQLIKGGANPFVPWRESSETFYPATWAMKYGREEVACALFVAMLEKDPEQFKTLLAGQDQEDSWGAWLSDAVRWHRPQVVRKLLDIGWPKGASKRLEQGLAEATCLESRRAVETARRGGHSETVQTSAEEIYRIFHDGENPPANLGRPAPAAPAPDPSP